MVRLLGGGDHVCLHFSASSFGGVLFTLAQIPKLMRLRTLSPCSSMPGSLTSFVPVLLPIDAGRTRLQVKGSTESPSFDYPRPINPVAVHVVLPQFI